MNIGLGTVQLGLPYGNRIETPLIGETDAFAIIDYALCAGIRFFDTAPAYGESEARLGRFGLGRAQVEISTKIPSTTAETWTHPSRYSAFVRECIAQSAARLRVDRLGLLQFHQCDVPFLRNRDVQDAMRTLLEERRCAAIGISVYTMEQAEAALDIDAVSALQVPINVVDTRFADDGFVQRCRAREIRLIARSILMQGVLVPDAELPAVRRADELAQLRTAACRAAVEIGRPLHALALAYVAHLDWLSLALIGADSVKSLQQNLAYLQPRPAKLSASDDRAFAPARALAADARLIDPLTWDAA